MPPPAHHTLESLVIDGGYLRGARLDFADGLNCIIGGRGSGKTTVLELLRFSLGAPVAPKSEETHDALVRGNLGAGRVNARVRTQHGMLYEASRSVGEPPRVATAAGELAQVSLDGELFKVEI